MHLIIIIIIIIIRTAIIIKLIIITIIIMIIISPWPRNTWLTSGRRYSHVLRADEALFSLGWQSSRAGVSIKNTGGCVT